MGQLYDSMKYIDPSFLSPHIAGLTGWQFEVKVTTLLSFHLTTMTVYCVISRLGL